MKYLFCFLLLSFTFKAQVDSAVAVPIVGVTFGGQAPSGDMVKRFGSNLRIGGSFLYKTKKNWLYGLESFYMFGRNVKEDVVAQLRTAEGFVVDNEGFPADIRTTQRGLTVQLMLGKLLPFSGSNQNSGLMVMIGAGYLQHKIHIYDAQQKIAAVSGDLKKGYDRLTNGFSVSEFLGYLYLSENRLLNFYLGVDCYQGFTKSVRKYNYDKASPDTDQRIDILTGFRVGWILPLYKKKPNDYYYN